jgi:cation/acetate symporter
VQIVKAALLLSGAVLIAILVLAQVGFSPLALFSRAAAANGVTVLAPGRLVSNPIDAVSLGLALMFGTAGLPHILMRFYTVPDARAARRSVFYATGLIGGFFLLVFVMGFGAMVLVGPEAIRAADPGGNMAAPLLASRLGGPLLLGFIGAVAFATILAVVAGLTLSGAAALSHDLWTHVVRRGTTDPTEELRVARVATLFLGGLAVVLGIAFKGQNVAFMVGLAFAIAASGNFPALLLTMFWRGCTTGGAVAAMITGTGGTLLLIGLSPTVQVDILHHADAPFPLRNPAIVSMPLAFAAAVATSLLTRNPAESAAFAAMERKALLGD